MPAGMRARENPARSGWFGEQRSSQPREQVKTKITTSTLLNPIFLFITEGGQDVQCKWGSIRASLSMIISYLPILRCFNKTEI